MSNWKKILFSLLLIILCITVFRIYHNPERKIRNFVTKNEEELTVIAKEYLSGERYYLSNQKDEYKGVEADGLKRGKHDIVEFFYSGKGIVPASVYYGFYYSPDDVPVSHQNGEAPVREVKEGEWEWNGIGDNGGVTKKIKENWYYYEAWY